MDIVRHLRQAGRLFRRSPTFTFVCAGTLALGIGAATAIYAVVDSVLLEPLPYPAHERLVGVWYEAPGLGFEDVPQSPALHFTTLEDGRAFEAIGMYTDGRATVTGLGDPEEVPVLRVTEGTLRIAGAQPIRGRIFGPSDDAHGAPLTVLVTWQYWQQRLDGDPNVVGRVLTVDGRAREVIGVLPADFRLMDEDAALFVPLQFDRAAVFLGNFSYGALARLRPGTTIAQAESDLARLLPVAAERFPGPVTIDALRDARFAPNIRPLAQDVIGDAANVLWVLLGTVGIVLLIACANVANLFLVRAEGRYREVAVRSAMGASRARLASEFMAESLVLAAAGGAAGIGMALLGLRLLKVIGPDQLPRLAEIGLDGSVLAVAVLLTVVTGTLLGLVPILRHGGDRVAGVLREGGRGGSAGRARHRARSTLVVGQLALALVLLAGSGLMMRSALAMRNVDPGFTDPHSLLTLRLAIPGTDASSADAVTQMHERLLRELQAVPGVASAAMTSSLPLAGGNNNDPIDVEDFPVAPGQIASIRRYQYVAPEYFATMGIPLLAGRTYTWDDVRNRSRLVIISESLARDYWDDPSAAIGKRVRNMEGRPWREIIGVAADVHDDGIDQPATPIAYWPTAVADMWQDGEVQTQWTMSYVLRLATPVTPALMDAVRTVVQGVNPNLPLADVRTMDERLEASMARTSFTLVLLGISAAVALLLGAIGLYGVISYTATQRTREFGVRMALGACAGDVGTLVLRHASVLVAIGIGVGLVASLALTRLMSAMLFGVAPTDPLTFASVAALLAVVAVVASLVPVARAARVDPLDALRAE